MSWDTGYQVINLLVMPAWALLIFAPRAGITHTAVHSALWPLVLGLFYICTLTAALFFGQSDPDAGFSSLAGVMALFDHPNGTLIGWSHYLVFDLFVGAWIGRDAQRKGLPHWQVIPCLLGAFIFGPVGLVLYMILRAIQGHGWSLIED